MRRQAATIAMLIACVAAGCSASIDVEQLDAGEPVAANPAIATTTPVATSRPDGPTPAASVAAGDGGGDGGATPTASVAPDATSSVAGDGDSAATGTPTAAATASPSAGPTASPEPSPTPVPTATTAPTPTPSPLPTATSVPVIVEFVIGAYHSLLGVELDTPAEPALAAMIAAIGDPDFDSGWYVGCPLDGEDLNERLVQWGDLNVYFDRFDDDPRFRAWGYDLRIVDGGFPTIDDIELPGGGRMGEPVNVVAAAAELDVVYDEVFDINRVGGDGFEIISDAPPGAPVWGAFVPAIPACE